jgi:pyroglutamyl-peptidase
MSKSRPKVLVTAFEPFDGRPANRSERWLQAFLTEAVVSGVAHRADVAGALLPVDFVKLPRALEKLWRAERPDVWILTGESGAGDALRVERVAVNLIDSATADNAGRVRHDAAIERGGPDAYFATLDPQRTRSVLKRGGVRAELSLTAGAFCCNQAFYVALRLTQGTKTRVIFLHIPRLAGGRGRPAPKLQDAARGLVALVLSVVRERSR